MQIDAIALKDLEDLEQYLGRERMVYRAPSL